MDPIAVPYAVSKKLVENARVRHDWGAMYITLKGNDREYYVDARVGALIVVFSSKNLTSSIIFANLLFCYRNMR